MFKILKQLFTKKNKDIRKRVYFTIAALTIFVIGTTIEVPGTQTITKNLGFLELLNVMGGGALKNFSIFALGVSPYITASIVIQLLQMDIVPYFSELAKQGHTGHQKLNQITRYVGIIFAFFQGYAMSYAFLGSNYGVLGYLEVSLIMTAGTAFLLWLGDEITKKGIGNGISLIIMAGIVNTLPQMFITTFNEFVLGSSMSSWAGILLFALFVILYIAIIIGIIYMQMAERRIPIQYSNRTASSYGGEKSFIPVKLNSASVVPVIFASALIGIPSLIAEVIKNEAFSNFVNNYIVYTSYTGFLLYMVLIFIFGYFYTLMQLNPEDMAENLDKNHSYIPGITPGEATSKYLKYVITRITVFGTICLMIIAAIPIIFGAVSKLPSNVTMGGTGLLIVVGVALESYKQLESSIVSRSYNGIRKRRRR